MASDLLVESRDLFESNDVRYFYDLAASLARAENGVTLFLLGDDGAANRDPLPSNPAFTTTTAPALDERTNHVGH